MSPPNPSGARRTETRVDLTNCDREAIHLLGRVQSYGALMAVSSDWIVQHASENLAAVLGIAVRDAIGVGLDTLLGADALERIRGHMRTIDGAGSATRIFDFPMGRHSYDLSIHQSGRHLIFEFETHEPRQDSDALSQTYPLIQRVREAATFEEKCRAGARGMQILSGFDTVMVYRFAPDQSGTVIAEAKRDDSPSYLGLRFPASDIPQQARALYKRALLRLIADVSDKGAAILPERTPEGQPIELSLAVTRAVSPVHLEYLRNMGVKSSMSVSILKDDDLWGLFACHHRSPHYIPFEKRTAIELFTHLFSYELMSLEEREISEAQARTADLHRKLLMHVADGSSLARALRELSAELQQAIPHDGAILFTGDKLFQWGATPDPAHVPELLRFLNTTEASEVFATDCLGTDHAGAPALLPVCAGVLAIPFSRRPRDYLILCRREVTQNVDWAGQPEKPRDLGPNGIRLTPRKSFEAWQETVTGQSEPWSPLELQSARYLRTLLLEVFLRISNENVDEGQRSHVRQELLIAELNHRVRNILNLMRGLVSQSRQDDMTLQDFARTLDGRIHAMALANDQLTREDWAPLPVKELINLEFSAFSDSASASRLDLSGADVLVTSEVYTVLALVVHEMVTNSVKYGALSAPKGRVRITLSRTGAGALQIDWQDIGGPPVSPPTRRGFGSTIIEKSIAFELGGESTISFPPEGVVARFVVPADYLSETTAVVQLGANRNAALKGRPKLTGPALVVEDSMIVAMDGADILTEFGATGTEMAGTVRKALDLIGTHRFEVALLDVNLGRQDSLEIARRLAKLGVPIVLTTGYGDLGELRARYPACAIVQKPFSSITIGAALVELGLSDA
ncbi:Bacteriophytochrome (light-regulated signal transduction histidine kinase) [Roseivivax lentus]|uniref:histidine kinase n=1 Tax=Roseivivax lentus TaxID=633194 RepID=A0A1N7P0G9_9RHOB|nr:HWE histidine kinase domain-containing protein [Roseivivax lentus]SIT03939.1 Bacteriophytochrome (light-regulated signal transduction histidine kinase) [Roseivivax lentus]